VRDQSAPGRTLWLVRHGESSWNAAGLVQGQRDGQMLTLHGRHQARRVAKRLASQSIASIVSSDLQRALQTAMPLSKILEKIVSNLLQVAKIDSDNTIPFAVRFKLVPDSEKFKP